MSVQPTDDAKIDVEAFARWMDDNGVPGKGELPVLTSLTGGSQNELTIIERTGQRMVMRRPPATAVADRLDGIRREHRLVKGVEGADVPHAQYIAGTDDAELLGMPFYIMEAIDGWSPADAVQRRHRVLHRPRPLEAWDRARAELLPVPGR